MSPHRFCRTLKLPLFHQWKNTFSQWMHVYMSTFRKSLAVTNKRPSSHQCVILQYLPYMHVYCSLKVKYVGKKWNYKRKWTKKCWSFLKWIISSESSTIFQGCSDACTSILGIDCKHDKFHSDGINHITKTAKCWFQIYFTVYNLWCSLVISGSIKVLIIPSSSYDVGLIFQHRSKKWSAIKEKKTKVGIDFFWQKCNLFMIYSPWSIHMVVYLLSLNQLKVWACECFQDIRPMALVTG